MSKNRIKHTVSNSKAGLSLKHSWRREGIPKGQMKRDQVFHPSPPLTGVPHQHLGTTAVTKNLCTMIQDPKHPWPAMSHGLGFRASGPWGRSYQVHLTIKSTRAPRGSVTCGAHETGWVGVCVCVCVCVLVAQSCRTLCNPMDCSLLLCPWGFSRQEYWSGLPCPPPGDLPNPGSPALRADSLPSEPSGKPRILEWVAYPFPSFSSWSRN